MWSVFKRKQAVLLLDDDPSMQRLVAAILKKEGFRVDVFLTGRDAIAAIERGDYAAMLLDLMMPHEGGTTVIRYLHARKPELLRRAIVLTASPQQVVAVVARDVAAVISKPFERDNLVRVVRQVSGAS